MQLIHSPTVLPRKSIWTDFVPVAQDHKIDEAAALHKSAHQSHCVSVLNRGSYAIVLGRLNWTLINQWIGNRRLDAAYPVAQQRVSQTHVVDKIHACAAMVRRIVIRLIIFSAFTEWQGRRRAITWEIRKKLTGWYDHDSLESKG